VSNHLEHLGSPPGFIGLHVAQPLLFLYYFVDHFVCLFSFGHCVVCTSSIYASEYPLGIFKLFDQRFIETKGHRNTEECE
jgi:hypothetical protein